MVEVVIDGTKHELRGRVAALIRWVVEHQRMIMSGHKTIRFLCRGRTINPSVEEHYDGLTEA